MFYHDVGGCFNALYRVHPILLIKIILLLLKKFKKKKKKKKKKKVPFVSHIKFESHIDHGCKVTSNKLMTTQ